MDFISIFQGRLTGDHSQEDLAKFGYKSERKEDFFEPPLYFGC
jgi:hypothetical protein